LNEQTNSQFYSGGSIFENKNHSITKGVLHNLNLIYLFVYCIVFIEKKFQQSPNVSFLIIVLDKTVNARAAI
jgi:hypothetical protein